jgi:hypothetical protein
MVKGKRSSLTKSCLGKDAFELEDLDVANDAARSLERRSARPRGWLRPYQCHHCRKLHVGHTEPKAGLGGKRRR